MKISKNNLIIKLISLYSVVKSLKNSDTITDEESKEKYLKKEEEIKKYFDKEIGDKYSFMPNVEKYLKNYLLESSSQNYLKEEISKNLKLFNKYIENVKKIQKLLYFYKVNSEFIEELHNIKENIKSSKFLIKPLRENQKYYDNYINILFSLDERLYLNQIESLLNKNIFIYFNNESRCFEEILDNNDILPVILILSKQVFSKKDIMIKEYYKLAFKYICYYLKEINCLFSAFDIDDFCIDPLEGLKLFDIKNIEILDKEAKKILRCDNCHNQLEYYFDDFFSSQALSQDSQFKCPHCNKIYTFSNLKRIYEKNTYNSYENI